MRSGAGLLTEDAEDIIGASFAVEEDLNKAAELAMQHIEKKCKALSL
ncbi:MAG: hypothetical protein K9L17_11905 [Clostridiales bacterium]|nr:hypothetical protein [Clostridiales bacterium]